MKISPLAVCLFVTILAIGANFLYYPKWNKKGTEATISWDVSGYYFYLPALFIYKDIKKVGFKQQIQDQYYPASSTYQSYTHTNGNEIMKYSSGMAISYLPFFLSGHLTAKVFDQPQDGFSWPYQLLIALESIFICFIGVFFCSRILIQYFSKHVVTITIFSICLGSNYLEYASISGAMSHNYLFTIYAAVIYLTIKYFKKPGIGKSILIGLLCGLAALIRPTDIIIVLIPMLWGISNKATLVERMHLLKRRYQDVLFLSLACILVGSIQLFYWKYVGGEWIIYSYGDQGFNWLKPNIIKGLFSARAGLFPYSPIIVASFIGIYYMIKKLPTLYVPILTTCFIGLYINFAWELWTYGGSLGQRNLIQLYPLFMFPFAALYNEILKSRILKWSFYLFIAFSLYVTCWWLWSAHLGQYFVPDQVNKKYLIHTFGKWKFNREYYKLLDDSDWYSGSYLIKNDLFKEDFEENYNMNCSYEPLEGNGSMCLNGENQFSPVFETAMTGKCKWYRAYADVKLISKEWDHWKMTQFVVKLQNGANIEKNAFIRIQRTIDPGQTSRIYFDINANRVFHDKITLQFWHAGSNSEVVIDNIGIVCLE